MPVQTPISVDEYLRTSFEYDLEYVEGVLEERKMPTANHAKLLSILAWYLYSRAKAWNVEVLSDCRIRVSPDRYRIPDISVTIGRGPQPDGPIEVAPLFVIEILSPDDSLSKLRVKAKEYLGVGVKHVWTVDPASGECYQHLQRAMVAVEDRILRVDGTDIEIPMAEIFESLR